MGVEVEVDDVEAAAAAAAAAGSEGVKSANSNVIFADDLRKPVQYSVCLTSARLSETEAVEGFDDDKNNNL